MAHGGESRAVCAAREMAKRLARVALPAAPELLSRLCTSLHALIAQDARQGCVSATEGAPPARRVLCTLVHVPGYMCMYSMGPSWTW